MLNVSNANVMLVLQANCARQVLLHVWYSSRCIIGLVTLSFNIFLASGCNLGCQNGGRCELVAANTYICVCPPEYTGNQCETSVLGKAFWYEDEGGVRVNECQQKNAAASLAPKPTAFGFKIQQLPFILFQWVYVSVSERWI